MNESKLWKNWAIWWNEINFNGARSTRNLSWVFFGLALFSLCGLRAAAAALLRKEEKTRADKPKGANSMKGEEWEWNEAEMECERIVELFWWNDNEIKRMKQTRQWNGGWMEPNPRSQKLRGKPRTTPNQCWLPSAALIGLFAEGWLVVLFSLGGLWAGGPANAPHKEDKHNNNQPNNQLMKPNWMKKKFNWIEFLWNEVGGMVWLSCFLHWACRSNYGIKGYMFCLQLPSIPASLPSSFIN